LGTLTGLADVDNPTKMQMPVGTNKVHWIKYNKKDVTWLDPKAFKDMIDGRDVDDATVDANGYYNDHDPNYWTSYDDDYVFFDSIDTSVDTTLVSNKCVAYSTTVPSWTASDSFIPTLPEKMFPTILASAKAQAFLALKQISNQVAENTASRGIVRAQNEAWRVKDAEAKSNKINYGRK
jgi:hypothetical protein